MEPGKGTISPLMPRLHAYRRCACRPAARFDRAVAPPPNSQQGLGGFVLTIYPALASPVIHPDAALNAITWWSSSSSLLTGPPSSDISRSLSALSSPSELGSALLVAVAVLGVSDTHSTARW